ncbi:MAG: phage terminase small subunit [Betaproteobacteria bacterium]|nr:phage terminase small subunit [Betaproteobacteria bacterium]
MSTPLHRHRLAAEAAARAQRPASGYGAEPTQGQALLLAKLIEDRRTLKSIKSIEQKAEAKRRMLPEYLAWVEGVLVADAGGEDEIVTTCMVWSLDTGDFERALTLGDYCLRHDLKLPEHYQRDVAALLVEQIADAAKAARALGEPFDIEVIERVAELTAERDIHDQIRAKLHKETGLLLEAEQPDPALWNLKRAQALNASVGVKKDIERIERAIAKREAGAQH